MVVLTSLDGTEGCHGGDGAGRRGQEEGHMGLDGGLGLERREQEDIGPITAKKKNVRIQNHQKALDLEARLLCNHSIDVNGRRFAWQTLT